MFFRWTFPKAHYIVGNSKGVVMDLRENFPILCSKLVVIPNPTLNQDITRLSKEEVLHPWFHQNTIPVVVAVGRLELQKDYQTLLKAFGILLSKQSAYLVIIGDGSLREDLLAQANELGILNQLCLVGFDSNPYKYMRRADLF